MTTRKSAPLDALARALLKKSATKTHQLGNYAALTLKNKKDLIKYAALDAALHYHVYKKLEKLTEFVEEPCADGEMVDVSDPSARHRVLLNFEAQAEGKDTDEIQLEILKTVPEIADTPVARSA